MKIELQLLIQIKFHSHLKLHALKNYLHPMRDKKRRRKNKRYESNVIGKEERYEVKVDENEMKEKIQCECI